MLRLLTSSASSVVYLAAGMAVLYLVVPVWVNFSGGSDPYFPVLAWMAAVSIAAIVVGFCIPWFDSRFAPGASRIHLSEPTLQAVIWLSFVVYLVVVLATVESVPLLSALRGASAQTLSDERGAFLKTRSGWQAILPYLGTLYAGALLPYAVTRLFVTGHRLRFAGIALFTLYTLLALEKTAFVLALGPVIYLSLNQRHFGRFAGLVAFSLGLLYLNTVLARGIDDLQPEETTIIVDGREVVTSKGKAVAKSGPYFSARYRPRNALDHIVWRSVSVPMFTAADALRVFDEKYNRAPLLGSTSTLLARATGRERVNYDAEVFAHQFGRSEIGRANSVFFTEAYVNFGWLGVVAFSLFVGLALRWLHKSSDLALQALWPLFCWFVFMGGLLGTLLSNGYMVVFALTLLGSVATQYSSAATRR